MSDPSSDPEASVEEITGTAERDRRRPGWQRALLVLLVSGLVIALIGAGGAWYLTHRYAGNITRIPDVFANLDEGSRPPPPTAADGSGATPTTFLLVGSDSRSDEPTTGDDATAAPGSQRSDVIMLMQIAADRQSAFAISIPRDSFVPVPGHGTTKINAAYAYGGASLLVQTVEDLTAIRVDHFALIDFEGFKTMTDALGGVDVQVAEASHAFGVDFRAGLNHLDGKQALAYVRQRYNLPGGDFDRVKRQQNYLRSMFAQVSREHLITDPAKLDNFLLAFTGAISVDDELSDTGLVTLALGLRNLKPADVAFLTAPIAGTGYEGAANVVYLDEASSQQMWAFIADGTLKDHLSQFTVLPAVPR